MFKVCLLVAAALALGPQAMKGQLLNAIDALDGEFPYHVLLKIGGIYFCSGALITYEHILTGGHCVERLIPSKPQITAVVGTNSIREGGETINIVGGAYKTGYVYQIPPSYLNDIGLYLLASKVTCSDKVKLVSLPKSNEIQIGSQATVTAAGNTCLQERRPSKVLQKLYVTIIDRDTCQTMLHQDTIDDSFICTWVPEGMGLSAGDSGAPLVLNDIIIGVAVGGANGRGIPDIHTNVYHHRRWIAETIAI